MAPRLILMCKDGPAKQAYIRHAADIGIELDAVGDFGELIRVMAEKPYQGVMLDVVTSIKAPREDKISVQEILAAFPLIQLKWDDTCGTINTISSGNCSSPNSSFSRFVQDQCLPFTPRSIRLYPRKPVHFNVVIKGIPESPCLEDRHLVSINMSRGGCFLYSVEDWSCISTVSLIIQELHDKTPILAKIRWWLPWGKTMALPGLGLALEEVTGNQMNELIEKYLL